MACSTLYISTGGSDPRAGRRLAAAHGERGHAEPCHGARRDAESQVAAPVPGSPAAQRNRAAGPADGQQAAGERVTGRRVPEGPRILFFSSRGCWPRRGTPRTRPGGRGPGPVGGVSSPSMSAEGGRRGGDFHRASPVPPGHCSAASLSAGAAGAGASSAARSCARPRSNPAPHGAELDPQGDRYLLVRQALDVTQDHGHAGYSGARHPAARPGCHRPGGGRRTPGRASGTARQPSRDVQAEALEPDPLLAARRVQEQVGGDAVQPAFERARRVGRQGREGARRPPG